MLWLIVFIDFMGQVYYSRCNKSVVIPTKERRRGTIFSINYKSLAGTALFRGMTEDETRAVTECLGAEKREYKRDELICRAGDTVSSMGIVLEGSAIIENDDLWGNRSILDRLEPGHIFAEAYACIPGEKLMVSVRASQPTRVLLLKTEKILSPCANLCACHSLLIRNLLSVSAQKNLNLSRRIFHTSAKSIRGRLSSYLSYQAVQNGSREFSVPFNRQQLADYLSVDRSALSSEIGKMQKEGLIKVNRNHFCLLRAE